MERRLIIADDESMIRDLFENICSISFPNVRVDTVGSAEELAHRLSSSEYDLILSDNDMECLDAGIDLLKRLREQQILTPFYIMSGRHDVHQAAIDAGATDFLAKPLHSKVFSGILSQYFS